jgi:hypothetical protein
MSTTNHIHKETLSDHRLEEGGEGTPSRKKEGRLLISLPKVVCLTLEKLNLADELTHAPSNLLPPKRNFRDRA